MINYYKTRALRGDEHSGHRGDNMLMTIAKVTCS